MQIIRDSYERTTYRYVLDVDADYIKEINDYAKKFLVEPDTWVDLVEQDFIDAFNGDESNPIFEREYTMKYGYQPEGEELRTYTILVGEWLQNVVNDDIWECDSEIVDSDGYDYETWIER